MTPFGSARLIIIMIVMKNKFRIITIIITMKIMIMIVTQSIQHMA